MLYIITEGYELDKKIFEPLLKKNDISIIFSTEQATFKSNLFRRLTKLLNLIGISCFFNFSKHFKVILKKIDRNDSILIWGTLSPLLIQLAKYVKTKKLNIWIWNPLFTFSEYTRSMIQIYKKYYKLWTFDENDAQKYKINYKSQVFYKQLLLPNEKTEIKYDLYFVGQDKNRYSILKYIETEVGKDFVCNFNLIRDKTSIDVENKDFYVNSVSFDDNIKNISQSKVLVDILQNGQYGITLRTYEALVSKKKLITNNTQIKKYPFYAKENIFILGEDEISTLKTFIKMPFNDFYDFSIYMIENWINDFYQ